VKILTVLAVLMFAAAVVADDTPDADLAQRTAAAKAKLEARKAAATQAAVSDDPAVLRAIILDQKQQIESLRATLAALNLELASTKNKLLAAAQPATINPPAAQAQPANNEKKVVVSATEWKALAKDRPDGLGFPRVGAVGLIHVATVTHIIDDSTALLTVGFLNADGMIPPSRDVPFMTEGVPTTGQADNLSWVLDSWFKIVGTRQYNGTTYMVVRQIVQAEKHAAQRKTGN